MNLYVFVSIFVACGGGRPVGRGFLQDVVEKRGKATLPRSVVCICNVRVYARVTQPPATPPIHPPKLPQTPPTEQGSQNTLSNHPTHPPSPSPHNPPRVLSYIQEVLTAYQQAAAAPAQRDYRLKDAALLVLGTLKKAGGL